MKLRITQKTVKQLSLLPMRVEEKLVSQSISLIDLYQFNAKFSKNCWGPNNDRAEGATRSQQTNN